MNDPTSGQEVSRKRPWLALVLTILVPGLGHVYLELWKRSLLWFGLYFVSTAVFLPENSSPDSLSVDAFVEASNAVPPAVAVLILGVSVLCLADAYLMASRINSRADRSAAGTRSCPNCGQELDDDLDFCHWCTTRLDDLEE